MCQSAGWRTSAGAGEYCGSVTDWVDWSPYPSTTQHFTEVATDALDMHGSSGGPWYREWSGSQIVGMGIMSAMNNPWNRRYYERVDPGLAALQNAASAYLYCDAGYGKTLCYATK